MNHKYYDKRFNADELTAILKELEIVKASINNFQSLSYVEASSIALAQAYLSLLNIETKFVNLMKLRAFAKEDNI